MITNIVLSILGACLLAYIIIWFTEDPDPLNKVAAKYKKEKWERFRADIESGLDLDVTIQNFFKPCHVEYVTENMVEDVIAYFDKYWPVYPDYKAMLEDHQMFCESC